MSLLFFDGFQDVVTMPKPEWGSTFNSQIAGRDGGTNGAARATVISAALPSGAATCIAGAAYQYSSVGSPSGSNGYLMGFVRSGTLECCLVINTSGMLELRRTNGTGTLMATSSGHAALTSNVWRHVQAKVVLHDTAGSVVVKLDGVTVINFSGQTAGVAGDVTAFALGAPSAGNLYIDDLWICDAVDASASQAAANNDFLGDMKVVSLFPTGAGDTTQFTPSTGSNWAAVDEVPPNTTDYVASATSGQRDLYGLADLPVGTVSPLGIRVSLYAAKSDAGASALKTVVKESGGTVTTGSSQPLSTSWAAYHGPMRPTRPSDGAAWTVADINALQVGVEVA